MAKEKEETIVNSGFNQLIGTDRYDDAELSFGPEYHEYRRKWFDYPREFILGDFPLHLDIESTNACNLRCVMCPRNLLTEKAGYIEWPLFQKLIDEGAEYHLPSIKLNYRGEPLLHSDLVDMVAYAKKKGILEVQFNTNGLLLTEEKAKGLIDAGLDRIIFSVDGATKETYEQIRTGSNYDKVVTNIKNLVKIRDERGLKRPSVRVQMVKLEQNQHEVEDFLKMWVTIANRIAVNIEREPGGTDKKLEHFPCPQIWQRLMVCWDGEVRMCCGDWPGEIVIGDATKSTIYEMWHSEKLNRVRKLHMENRFDEIPACSRCEVNTPLFDSEVQRIVGSFNRE